MTDIDNLVRFGFIEKHRKSKYSKSHNRVIHAKTAYTCLVQTDKDSTLVPRSFFRAEISFSVFTLACCFLILKGSKHRAFPSHSRITADLGIHKRTTRRVVKELEAAELLHVEHCKTAKECFAANSYFLMQVLSLPSVNFSEAEDFFAVDKDIKYFTETRTFPKKPRHRVLDASAERYQSFFELRGARKRNAC